MIKKHEGITIAEFASAQSITAAEVQQADLVIIHEHVPKGIYGPSYMLWMSQLPLGGTNPLCLIHSKRGKKGVVESADILRSTGHTISTVPVTQELFEEFSALYAVTTATKPRNLQINLDLQIMQKVRCGFPAFFSMVSKDNTMLSALAFSIQDGRAMVSVGAKQRIDELRGGVGGVLEVELVRACLELGLPEISHGKNKNPVGMFNKIGQFSFKARYGYTAYPQHSWATFFLRNPNAGLSDWLFLTLISGELGYLVVSLDPSAQHPKELATPQITALSMTDATTIAQAHRAALDELCALATPV